MGVRGLNKVIRQTVKGQLYMYPVLAGEDTDFARQWCGVIDAALAALPDDRRRAMEFRYVLKYTEQRVLDEMPVGRTTWLKWRADFLADVAIRAAYVQLIHP